MVILKKDQNVNAEKKKATIYSRLSVIMIAYEMYYCFLFNSQSSQDVEEVL